MASKTELIFGIHSIEAILKKHPERVLELKIQNTRNDDRVKKISMLAVRFGAHVEEVKKEELNKLAGTMTHQGVVARIRSQPALRENDLLNLLNGIEERGEKPFFLVLDTVTDPHNLGACLRSADAAGVHGIIAPKDRSVGLNGTVRKVASGAAETVPFIQVTNLARTLIDLKERGIWCTGAALSEQAKVIYDVDLTGPLALVMGAEGGGLRRLTAEICDHLVFIPMMGEVASLNVSVASGICLYEAVRQRRTLSVTAD